MKRNYTEEQRRRLKEIRDEIKIIREDRRDLLKKYRYWKRKEYEITNPDLFSTK